MENKATTDYREILEKDGVLAQLPVGFSMYPMLRQKHDTVVIEKINEKPKENDVVFYQKDNGKYVLHRVIKVEKEGYIIRGDNCFFNEYDIKDRHILGILKGFYRGEKYVDCQTNKKYKIYVFFNRSSYYVRYFLHSVRSLLSKIKRKIIK
ncbi:MAG: S24/S26 family peptidase [Clostridia bacterium]|nr:S24/S26 family peptidase [Clostridia bacterium]